MSPPGATYPPFLDELADIFEQARPNENSGAGSVTSHIQLKSTYRNVGVAGALRNVALMLSALEVGGNGDTHFTRATNILADASREEQWRLPFGDCDVMDFYLDLVAKEDHREQHWLRDAFRLIGNCCALDLDQNRERVLAKLDMSSLIRRLRDETDPILPVAVLNNLCLDYEPAQKAATSHRLFPALVDLLAGVLITCPSGYGGFLHVCQLMEFAIEEPQPEECTDNAVFTLYEIIITQELDVGNQVTLANAVAALLKHLRHQKLLLVQDEVAILLILYIFTYTQNGAAIVSNKALSVKTVDHAVQEPEDEEQLNAIRSTLSARLWDISTLPEFASTYPPTSGLVKVLISWISASEPERQLCACSVLRNYVCSDEIATQMVQSLDCFESLIDILMTDSGVRVLEEALRLLRNLALPLDNRKLFSELAILNRLSALLTEFDSPTLQSAAISLFRQVIKGQRTGVMRVVETSPRNGGPLTTSLSRLLTHYKETTDLTVRTEIGRTIVEMWRTVRSPAPSLDAGLDENAVDETLIQYGEDVTKPVVALITRSNNPSLVTEGWFGLNLMASSRPGSDAVFNALRGDEAFTIFKATILGDHSGSKDRENARILADKLLKDTAAHSYRRAILEPLLSREGTQMESPKPKTAKMVGNGL